MEARVGGSFNLERAGCQGENDSGADMRQSLSCADDPACIDFNAAHYAATKLELCHLCTQ